MSSIGEALVTKCVTTCSQRRLGNAVFVVYITAKGILLTRPVTNITIFKCVDKMSGQLIKWSDIVCYMFMPSGLCLCMHNIVLLLSNKGYQAV